MPLLSSIQRPEPPVEINGALPEMIQSLVATLHSYEDLFGPYHPQTLAVFTKLAVALWAAGELNSATCVLERAVERLTSALGTEHPARLEALTLLAGVLFEQCSFEEANVIQREVLNCRVRDAGPDDPDALIAKADLAAVLFELGASEEAELLEQECLDSARANLGTRHFATSLIAWNRVHRHERRGETEGARDALVKDLLWLLAEDPESLDSRHNTIRTMLAKRLNWDSAPAC